MSIFVSYSRLDEQVVKALAQGLEAAHRDVWFDHDLGGGEVWWVKILESIRQADVVIFALSDKALRSKPCRAELDYALALDRTVLPIKVGPVANFRANPLSALQTIEFREQDARSAFAIIAAVDEAAKRVRPLPAVLPALPQIPFAYLVSLSKQIDSGELSPKAQIDAIDELRKAFREETDESVHDDILSTLQNLKSKPWATVQAAAEVDAVLAWAEGHRRPASAKTEPVPGEPTEAESEESDEDAERKSRSVFESSVAEAVLRQQQEQTAASQQQAPAKEGVKQRAGHQWGGPPAPPEVVAEQVEQIKKFEGVSRPLRPPRAPAGRTQPAAPPSYFGQPHPAQPHQTATTPAQQPPAGPLVTRTPPPLGVPVAARPRPYWGWTVVGLCFSIVFGLVALYFSLQVGKRWAVGDVPGAQQASRYARIWGVVGLVVGLLLAIARLSS